MTEWSNPEEVQRDYAVFERMMFVLLGVCVWEVFATCDFEWSLLTRRRKFKWPLFSGLSRQRPCIDLTNAAFFFLSRYCIVLAFVGLILSLSVTTKINCHALYTFNSWAGNMTILSSSTSLMLRTIALWERQYTVMIPLGLFCVGHWAWLYRTMFIVHADWDDSVRACVVVQASPSALNATFFLTMGFDGLILAFTAIALFKRHTARTDLWKLLFRDGLVYFLVTFSANCIPAVLNLINLNTPMNVIATVPAALISSIASGRAVMRLLEFSSQDTYRQSFSALSESPQSLRMPLAFTVASPKFPAAVHAADERKSINLEQYSHPRQSCCSASL